jgi:hypothetical protein
MEGWMGKRRTFVKYCLVFALVVFVIGAVVSTAGGASVSGALAIAGAMTCPLLAGIPVGLVLVDKYVNDDDPD